MKEHRFRNYIYLGITAVLVIVTCIAAALMFIRWQSVCRSLRFLGQVLSPVTYGAVLAYLLSPVYNRTFRWTDRHLNSYIRNDRRRKTLAKAFATLISLLFLVIAVTGLLRLILPRVIESIKGIINSIPSNAAKIALWIETLFADYPDIEMTVMNVYNQGVERLMAWTQTTSDLIPNIEKVITSVYTSIVGVVSLVKNVLIGIIVMLYLLNIKDTLAAQSKKIIYSLLSLSAANEFIDKCRFIHKVF